MMSLQDGSSTPRRLGLIEGGGRLIDNGGAA